MPTVYLCIDKYRKELWQAEVRWYARTMTEKVFPLFDDIDGEVNQLTEDYYRRMMYKAGYCDDPSGPAEEAMEYRDDCYGGLRLARHNIIGMSIVNLAQMWEQQVRRYLYQELSRVWSFPMTRFCEDWKQIIGIFAAFSIRNDVTETPFSIEDTEHWTKLSDLSQLANSIKHGDGRSAESLRKRRPEYFMKREDPYGGRREMETTLLCETNIFIDVSTFTEYVDPVVEFWNTLPRRLECDADILEGKLRKMR